MNKIAVSKFDLMVDRNITTVIDFESKNLKSQYFMGFLQTLLKVRDAQLIFISNPQPIEMLFCYLYKLLGVGRAKIVFFDLIMRAPAGKKELILARLKSILLGAVDWFLFIQKDIGGFVRHYGIPEEKAHYVPFKPNNLDMVGKVKVDEGDYILSLGASQRDYSLLIQAIKGTGIPLKIILSKRSMEQHNASMDFNALPDNVVHISRNVDKLEWNELIAGSKFVVIPILKDVIQPAGISVYLEAMIYGKPVVITRGASTEQILNDDMAMLVPQADVEAMRSAIVKLWGDKELREKLSKNCKAYAESLKNHERMVDDIRRFVEACV